MVTRQSVNLRTGGPALRLPDPEQRARYDNDVCAARAAQTEPYVLAPRMSYTAPASGRVVTAGQELRLSDCEGARDADGRAIPAWRVLSDLVQRGVVLEADPPQGPAAA